MKLSALIAPLLDAKADHETIRRVVLAFEAEQVDALERRRKTDAERQARKRSRDVTLRHSDRVLVREPARVEDKTLTSEIEPLKEEKSARRATRLPETWTLPDDWRGDARAAGLPEAAIDGAALDMRDWSLSSPNGAKRDWRATWRTWCRRKAADTPKARAGPMDGGKDSIAKAAQRRLEVIRNGRQSGTGADDHQPVAGLISGNPIRLAG